MAAGTNRLRELRLQSGKSQEVVSGFVCVAQSTYSGYENGKAIPSDIAIRLSDYFNVSLEYLLGISDERHGCYTPELSPKAMGLAKYYDCLSVKKQLAFDKCFDAVKIIMDEN